MKKLKLSRWIIIGFVMSLFTLVACGTEDNTEALITAITIGTERLEEIPEPIPFDEVGPGVGADTQGILQFNTLDDMRNVRVEITASPGARIALAVGTSATIPPNDLDMSLDDTFSFNNLNWLWILVTSGDGSTSNYYRVQVSLRNATARLNTLSIGEIPVPIPAGNSDWDAINSTALTLTEELIAATVTAVAALNGTVRFAKFDAEDTPLAAVVFTTDNVFNFEDGDFFAIEVTSENTMNTIYFQFEILINRERPWMPGEDFTVPLEGLVVRNPNRFTRRYDFHDIPLVFPENFDVSLFTLATVNGIIFNIDEEIVPPVLELGQISFRLGNTTLYGRWNLGVETINMDITGTSEHGGYPGFQGETPTTLRVQNSNEDLDLVAFIEITEIRFHN